MLSSSRCIYVVHGIMCILKGRDVTGCFNDVNLDEKPDPNVEEIDDFVMGHGVIDSVNDESMLMSPLQDEPQETTTLLASDIEVTRVNEGLYIDDETSNRWEDAEQNMSEEMYVNASHSVAVSQHRPDAGVVAAESGDEDEDEPIDADPNAFPTWNRPNLNAIADRVAGAAARPLPT